MVKILIVDDHSVIRSGMKALLEIEVDGASVFLAASIAEALQTVEASQPFDLVLLDLKLPDANGFHGLARLKQADPAMSVALISGEEDRETVNRARAEGADGFIPKTADPRVIVNVVELLLTGEVFFPRVLFDGEAVSPGPLPEAGSRPERLDLTKRQTDVYSLVVAGLSNKEIARDLELTESTVKTHVAAILQKAGATSRGKLIARSKNLTDRYRA
jgi:two-component system nitrate/nitrite response regulator NarL